MSERETTLPTALMEEREGLEDEHRVNRQRLTEEVSRLFPGVDHVTAFRLAFKNTDDFSGAEDVLQSVYLSMTRLCETDRREIRALTAYMSASIRREATRWRKKHHPENHEPLDDELEDESIDFVDRIADDDEASFMLRQIPKHCREVYVLFNRDDYTMKEISEKTGVKVETIKKRLELAALHLALARDKFREEQSRGKAAAPTSNTLPTRKESPYGKH